MNLATSRILDKINKLLLFRLLEMVVILYFVFNLLRPASEYTFSNDDFEQEYAIRAGAYSVVVTYDVNEETDLQLYDIAGSVNIQSKKYRALTRTGEIYLTVGDAKKSETVWFLCSVDDMKISSGESDAVIKSVEFKECIVYRYTMLVFAVLLCILFEMLHYYYYHKFVNSNIRDKLVIIILILLWIFSSLPVMDDITYIGHDIEFHIARIVSIANGLADGQLPVYMYSDMLNGHGYASPLFYGDMFLYLPAVLYLLKIPLGVCYNIYILFINGLTVFLSYVAFQNVTGRKKYALLGAILYTLSLYRLTNIYTRSAMGEYSAMVFFPLIIMGLYNMYSKDEYHLRDCMLVILGLTGVIQNHVLSTEMVGIFIMIFCFVKLKKTLQLRRFLSLCGIVICTLLLNADFFVPFIDSKEMDLCVFDKVNSIQYKGAYMSHIFNPISQGYGVSGKEMSLSMGGGLIAGFVICCVCMILLKKLENKIKLFWWFGALALLFSTRYFPWDLSRKFGETISKYIGAVQFPWRYLSIACIMISFAIVLLYQYLERENIKFATILIGITVGASILSVGDFYAKSIDEMEVKTYLSESEVMMSYVGSGEYLPIGTDEFELRDNNVKCDQNVRITNYCKNKKQHILSCENISDHNAKITIPILNYEHYIAYDCESLEEFTILNGENNNIMIEIPAYYKGNIVVDYKVRTAWKIANLISVITLLILMVFYKRSKVVCVRV